jgi:ribosomal protein S18 acetylase RimI-like enzyme
VNDLPEIMFANPVWHALHTKHQSFAISAGEACRYAADVVPFAAVIGPTGSAMEHLHSLLAPGDAVWLIGEKYPPMPGLVLEETLECFQLVLSENASVPKPTTEILPLTKANAQEMVALTTLAFPGFFRERTCEMGTYYGARSASGELIAMGGERLQLGGYSEISGVCTHPSFRGQGLAAALIWQLARDHRRDGVVSWLHVGSANHHAIRLYSKIGFEVIRKVTLHRFLGKS